jgi:hypothetical protein
LTVAAPFLRFVERAAHFKHVKLVAHFKDIARVAIFEDVERVQRTSYNKMEPCSN